MTSSPTCDALLEARRVFGVEIEALQSLAERLDDSFSRSVVMLQSVIDNGGKIIGLGVGKSGNICRKIAATLTSTGSPALCLDTADALHGDLGIVRDGDAVLALSYSGETPELLKLLPHVRRFRVNLIALTGQANSPLARHADITLLTTVNKEACPLDLAPTASTTAMLVMGDAIALALMKARGFDAKDFARFHPGGSLGRQLLLEARDLMRPLERTVFARSETEVGTVVGEMVQRKAGAAIVVDQDGCLKGIFTHGDFARAYQTTGHQLEGRRISEFMSSTPVFVHADQLAAEVLQTLKTHKVDDLVVLERNTQKAVGIIDCQDLTRLKLI